MLMSHFGTLWHFVRFENAHLIEEPDLSELVVLLMSGTVHTSHTCTVEVISNSTKLCLLLLTATKLQSYTNRYHGTVICYTQ